VSSDYEGPRIAIEKLANIGIARALMWAVKGLLPLDAFVIIYGLWGVGKSYLALNLLMILCSHLGRKVKSVDPETGFVTYARGAEYPTTFLGLPARSDLTGVVFQVEPCADLNNRVEAARIGAGLKAIPTNMLLSKEPINLGDKQQAEALINLFDKNYEGDECCELQNADALILDTVSAATPGLSETTHEGISVVSSVVDRIRQHRPCLCVLLTHPPENTDKVRGHGSFPAHADVILSLEPDDDNCMILRQRKNRCGPLMDPIRIERKIVQVAVDRQGEPVTAWYPVRVDAKAPAPAESDAPPKTKVAKVNANDTLLMEVYASFATPPTKAEWRQASVARGVSETTFDRRVNDHLAVVDGPVHLGDDGRYHRAAAA